MEQFVMNALGVSLLPDNVKVRMEGEFLIEFRRLRSKLVA
jgi:hypothetical protein